MIKVYFLRSGAFLVWDTTQAGSEKLSRRVFKLKSENLF
jgi:hypothetical protein